MDVAFPFHFDDRGRTASAASRSDHVRDMIEQLLLTNPGERVNRPDFGGGLAQLVFAPARDELVAALEFGLSAALAQWLGDVIDVQRLTVTSGDARVRIELDYVVRRNGEARNDRFDVGTAP